MKKIVLISLTLFGYMYSFSQCIQEPVYLDLDNSFDTIELTGRCGNPLDEPDTYFLQPENFGYIQNENSFIIDCGFTKNCARAAMLIILANDTTITISKHEVDTGEATTCEDYETFTFWVPLSSKGYFHIYINGFDTTISGLSAVPNSSFNPNKVFPNPVADKLMIELTNNKNPKQVQIFNTGGQLIMNRLTSSDSFNIDISELKKGIYFIRVQDMKDEKVILTEQIIKE